MPFGPISKKLFYCKEERKRRKMERERERERERELWAPGISALNQNHDSDNIINVLLYFNILVLSYRKLERFDA